MSEETAPFVPAEQDTRADPPPTPDPFPGELRLLRALGHGAFGDVWLAEDLYLGRVVALKFLRCPDKTGSAQALAILQNEARLMASVVHPNIVQVHAWRNSSAGPCLVLQYVAGGSLQQRAQREGPLPWPKAARYIADVADGLLAGHQRGIIHRDV